MFFAIFHIALESILVYCRNRSVLLQKINPLHIQNCIRVREYFSFYLLNIHRTANIREKIYRR
jgi:hypothetical protein